MKDLPFGAYSFVEKQAPTGYVLTKESIPFSISEQGKTIMLTAKNKHITGELEISKVDIADGNNKLPNAEFTIFNEQGKEVAKGKRMKTALQNSRFHMESTRIKKHSHQTAIY